MKKWLAVFLMCASVAMATQVPGKIAVIRGLDKITGRTKTFSVPVGSNVQFGKIFIEVKACSSHPPEESPEDAAFLYIYEQTDAKRELFQGWMFSSNPALSTMEDPVYDVWLLDCLQSSEPTPTQKTAPETALQPEPSADETNSNEEITD